MGALQYVDIPGYSALVIRRTFADLSKPKALMDRADEWLRNTSARWVDKKKQWVFPSGATLSFGYMEAEKDKFQYQSAEYQYIGFDELTQFSETQYVYLFSRLRRLAGVQIPLRMRSASNPGGVGHAWVKQRFLVEGLEKGRIFIPAKLDDNPHLDRAEYIRSLSHLDPITRQQLLDGNWEARHDGGIFKRDWFGTPLKECPPCVEMVRYWDRGATPEDENNDPDWTVGTKYGRTASGLYVVAHVVRFRGTPLKNEQTIRRIAEVDGRNVEVNIPQDPGSAGKDTVDHYRRNVLPGFKMHAEPETGSKVERSGPVSSQAEAGNVKVVEGAWLGDWFDELELFPCGGHDDQVDSLSGAHNRIARKPTGTMWIG